MFQAFIVYAIEDYSKIPTIEAVLREDIHGVVQTTDSAEKAKALLDELEKKKGFVDWKKLPELEYNLALTEIRTNVNPYWIRWEIVFDVLKRKLGIQWAWWSTGLLP
jgi:hypothetical protein